MSLTYGPNLGLLVNANAGEGHYTAWQQFCRGIDGLVQPVVKQVSLNTPPGSPADGDCYIVGTSPSGAWSGQNNKIARYSTVAAVWEFYTPKNGWEVFDQTTSQFYVYGGSTWAVSSVSDSLLVHLAGTETITGAKTFSALLNFTNQLTGAQTLTATGAGNNYGMTDALDVNPAGSSAASFQGLFQSTTVHSGNAQNITGNIMAIRGLVDHEGTGTVTEAYGTSTRVKNGSTGVITTSYGHYIGLTNSGGGTIGTAYGLYVESQAPAGITTGYAVYTNAGLVRVGDTTDATTNVSNAALMVLGGGAFTKSLRAASFTSYGGNFNVQNSANPAMNFTDTTASKTWGQYYQHSATKFWLASESGVADWVSVTNATGVVTVVSTAAIALDVKGGVSVATGKTYQVNGTQVVAARKTGWSTWTGTATRTSQATYSGTASASYVQAELQGVMDQVKKNSEAIKALIDDLHGTAGHGLIGT